MSRRPRSPSSSPRLSKKVKFTHLTSEDFKDGVFLAPMVRSGALPTRLFALKYGATLVWSPEVVDKAILHAERVVDPVTGVISYNGKSRAIFTTHPIEKPHLIYQIGSADPELAVQAAKTVMHDVSGIDLNCGCPKPFSTHAGMGAALLTNPDLLCSILTALRRELPPEITVSAKIRLLPDRGETLKLVERIVGTGISALTVHCRTRNMRDQEPAMIDRLKEIVDFVNRMGTGIAVIENGDCTGWEDANRVREATGAHSVMIARGAESNPSCFSSTPLYDVEQTLAPAYIRLAKFLGNYWGLTKFCVSQFHAKHVNVRKADAKRFRDALSKAKSDDDPILQAVVGDWTGQYEFEEIVEAVRARLTNAPRRLSESSVGLSEQPPSSLSSSQDSVDTDEASSDTTPPSSTPTGTVNPEPPGSGAPFLPPNGRFAVPAFVSGKDPETPTPIPAGRGAASPVTVAS